MEMTLALEPTFLVEELEKRLSEPFPIQSMLKELKSHAIPGE